MEASIDYVMLIYIKRFMCSRMIIDLFHLFRGGITKISEGKPLRKIIIIIMILLGRNLVTK